MKFYWFILVVFLTGCNNKRDTFTKPVVQHITESVYASGVVESNDQYEVVAPVAGIIGQQMVQEGDTIQKGDILVSLLHETSRLNVEQAATASAYAAVQSNKERLGELQNTIEMARIKMFNDSALFFRQQNLWDKGIGSRHELEQKKLSWQNAIHTFSSAQLELSNLKKAIDYEARQSEKKYQLAVAARQDYVITARQKGRVYQILKHPGEMVNPQTVLAVIGDNDRFKIKLKIDEFDIARVAPGQRVYITLDSYKGQVYEAVIKSIQPIMDDRSRSFEAEAEFNTFPPRLYPNLTVEANILTGIKTDALTIPRNYLMYGDSVLLKNGKKRKVTTGLRDYSLVEITGGLTRNDYIQIPRQ